MSNFWDDLMETDEGAAVYLESYGEGPGSETRHTIGSFINDGETVLDVGCGPAWCFDHFAQYGPKVGYKGIDYSERFVRVANKRLKEKYNLEHRVELGDCRDLKWPDESQDVVILQDCLEHTNGYEKPVNEALRVARKRVIISFWHLEDTDNEHINDDGKDGWGAWYDKAKWEKFLDSLPYLWLETESSPEANRKHLFYLIEKEVYHG
jgi:ubiquinone/menaquinone biosynthesis C-methylase UbiE